MKTRRQYDEALKKMAVDLSITKGSLKITTDELEITPQILTRWRRERVAPHRTNSSGQAGISKEQQEIIQLKKQLKQAELERAILKKAVSIFSKSDGTFFNS